MEELTKSQLILLALFVSFVTSIATGIVTVTLMDQAPPGVTQTINRVVERTVQTIVPSGTEVVKEQVTISQEDFVVDAIEKNAPSIVSVSAVGESGSRTKLGVGVVLTADGIFVTDQAFLSRGVSNLRGTYQGKEFSVEKVFSDSASSFAFLKAVALKGDDATATTTGGESSTFTPAKLADSDEVKLGQTAIMLGGGDGKQVALGIVSRLAPRAEDSTATSTAELGAFISIETNTTLTKDSTGGPMIAIDGRVIGITIVESGEQFAIPSRVIAYTLSQIMNTSNESASSTALSDLVGRFLRGVSGSSAATEQNASAVEAGSPLTQ